MLRSTVPDEVLVYVLGHLGEPPAPINPEVLDRMLSTPRGKEIQKWTPPQPTIEELKEQHGDRSMTDEELLRRYLVPLPDVEATHAAGPAAREFHFEDDGMSTSMVLDLLQTSRASFAHVETVGLIVSRAVRRSCWLGSSR